MDRIYAQVVDGVVNLIGGAEVGLPHDVINERIQVIDITDFEEKPQEGWFYTDGVFLEDVSELMPEPEIPSETLEQKLARLKEQNLILMDALATTFEELLALRELVEGGTAQ